MDQYEHQLEVRKRDGSVYKLYVVSHGSGFTYIIYLNEGHVLSDPHIYDSIDAAFQSGFDWIRAQK